MRNACLCLSYQCDFWVVVHTLGGLFHQQPLLILCNAMRAEGCASWSSHETVCQNSIFFVAKFRPCIYLIKSHGHIVSFVNQLHEHTAAIILVIYEIVLYILIFVQGHLRVYICEHDTLPPGSLNLYALNISSSYLFICLNLVSFSSLESLFFNVIFYRQQKILSYCGESFVGKDFSPTQ